MDSNFLTQLVTGVVQPENNMALQYLSVLFGEGLVFGKVGSSTAFVAIAANVGFIWMGLLVLIAGVGSLLAFLELSENHEGFVQKMSPLKKVLGASGLLLLLTPVPGEVYGGVTLYQYLFVRGLVIMSNAADLYVKAERKAIGDLALAEELKDMSKDNSLSDKEKNEKIQKSFKYSIASTVAKNMAQYHAGFACLDLMAKHQVYLNSAFFKKAAVCQVPWGVFRAYFNIKNIYSGYSNEWNPLDWTSKNNTSTNSAALAAGAAGNNAGINVTEVATWQAYLISYNQLKAAEIYKNYDINGDVDITTSAIFSENLTNNQIFPKNNDNPKGPFLGKIWFKAVQDTTDIIAITADKPKAFNSKGEAETGVTERMDGWLYFSISAWDTALADKKNAVDAGESAYRDPFQSSTSTINSQESQISALKEEGDANLVNDLATSIAYMKVVSNQFTEPKGPTEDPEYAYIKYGVEVSGYNNAQTSKSDFLDGMKTANGIAIGVEAGYLSANKLNSAGSYITKNYKLQPRYVRAKVQGIKKLLKTIPIVTKAALSTRIGSKNLEKVGGFVGFAAWGVNMAYQMSVGPVAGVLLKEENAGMLNLMIMFLLNADKIMMFGVLMAVMGWLVRSALWFLVSPLSILVIAIPRTNAGHSSWKVGLDLALKPLIISIMVTIFLVLQPMIVSLVWDIFLSSYMAGYLRIIESSNALMVTPLLMKQFLFDFFFGDFVVGLLLFLVAYGGAHIMLFFLFSSGINIVSSWLGLQSDRFADGDSDMQQIAPMASANLGRRMQ